MGAPGPALDIVLWLDLAEVNQMHETTVREHTPPGATILRLTEYGAKPYGEGTPRQWPPALDAIDRLVRHARGLERQSTECRYWLTGRAGLPAFLHLGHRLSQIAAVTFVHQPENADATIPMPLDAAKSADTPRYFEPTPWPVPYSETGGPAVIAVSSEYRPTDDRIRDALLERRTSAAGIVHAHSPERIDAVAAVSAMCELRKLVRATRDAHPRRSALATFIRGPSVLAFLVGRALGRRVCRDVQVFEYDGAEYRLAYELPYPPVPDRNKVLFYSASPAGAPALALDQEIRAIRLERSPGMLVDRLDLVTIPTARASDLRELRTRQPAAVHFSGHGETGELLFQDDDGAPRPLSTADLAETIRLAESSVRLVVLSACHSESHAEALLAHVDCVVAMRGRIWDDDARRFAATFYRQLAEGDSVRDAFDRAINEMRLHRPAAGSAVRDVNPPTIPAESGEPPQLHERDPGCADITFLVRGDLH